jgi:glycosidase
MAIGAVWLFAAGPTIADDAALVLENSRLRLAFDSATGAWTSFVDKQTGDDLIASPKEPVTVAPASLPTINTARLDRAISDGRAIRLTGEWLFTPQAVSASETARLLSGNFDGVKWTTTPVPSQRGQGDDKLHDRLGDFWYRREFVPPAEWSGKDLALIIGAIDDLDVAYINGTQIGSTGQHKPHHWETPRLYQVPARILRPGQPNVLLCRISNGLGDGGISGPVVLGNASDLDVLESHSPALTQHDMKNVGVHTELQLKARAESFEYTSSFTVPALAPVVFRQITITNISDKPQIYQTATYATPPLSVGPTQVRIFPGSLPVGDAPTVSLTANQAVRSRSEDPLAVLWDASKQRGLGTWFACEDEFSPVSVERVQPDGAVILRHTQNIVASLAPGESVTLGRQILWLSHGSRDAALAAVQDVYRAIDLRAPSKGLSGLRGMIVYCGHPGGPPELDFRRYGGFRALSAYVPTLKKLQVDLLWLLPIWEHGEDPKWNLYSPFDHFRINRIYGSDDELKQLGADCGNQGIRLIFDLVPHGPPDFTPLAKDHPEWVAKDREGKPVYAWNQLAFDNHHPGWQDYMRRAAEWGARQFGAVGARVDCAAGGPLNWNPEVTKRPSLSSLAAGLGMCRAIREGYLRAHQQVCLLPEEYTGANIYYRVADLTYDAQFYYLQSDLLERKAPPEEWARDLQQFLHDQQQTLPPGALKMRWISNHDTVSWTFQKQRPAKAYGTERMRALLAMCAFIDGVPMLYQGDEDPAVYGQPGASNIDFLAKVYGLRKKLPAVREGSADYAAATATSGVFACLRESKEQRALVLISFNPQAVSSTITSSRDLSGEWTDELSGESLSTAKSKSVSMQPYQVRVFVQRSGS